MRRAVLLLWLLTSACGANGAEAARARTDVLTVEWTTGDDVPLDPSAAPPTTR